MTVRSLDNGASGAAEPAPADRVDRPGPVGQPGLRALAGLAEQLSRQLPGPLSRLTLRHGEDVIEIDWEPTSTSAPGPVGADRLTPAPAPGRGPEPGPVALSVAEPTTASGHELAAPLVGTFYRCPEPGAAPFVKPGDVVQPGQQVAIIEAMKMLVSVNADAAATVVEVLVEDGRPVEYGQPLMLLSPLADAAAER